ncbi:MAG: hypothetical protein IH878_13480 [Gemmatimonadetes bacterium]|nr:hypothetical protein [Gemmatimonadota bacterium]
MFELKPLPREGIEVALEKVERYRLLGEPWEAESICRDVLAVDPENQEALRELIGAIAQQIGSGIGGDVSEAVRLVGRLRSDFDREYYAGIIQERRAKELLAHGTLGVGPAVYDLLLKAMEYYEKAQALSRQGDDSALLRWNTCARIIMQHNLKAAPGPPSGKRGVGDG